MNVTPTCEDTNKPKRIAAKIFLWPAGIAAAGAAASGTGIIILYLNPFSLLFCDDPGICNSLSHISRFAIYQAVPFILVGLLSGIVFIRSYFFYNRARYVASIALSALLMMGVASALYASPVQHALIYSRTMAAPLLGNPEVRHDSNNNANTPRFECPDGNTFLTVARGDISLYSKSPEKALSRGFADERGDRIFWRVKDDDLLERLRTCRSEEGKDVYEYLNIPQGDTVVFPSSFEIPGVAWILPNHTLTSNFNGQPISVSYTYKNKWIVEVRVGDLDPVRYDAGRIDDAMIGPLWFNYNGIDARTNALVFYIAPPQSSSN